MSVAGPRVRLFLVLVLTLLVLACPPWAVLDREFSACWTADFRHRDAIGLRGYVVAGMTEEGFREAFEAHHAPQSRLSGPLGPGDSIFGGTPKQVFARAFLIVDRTGCPLWRFFFDEEGRLVAAETLYQEMGSYFFADALKWLTSPPVGSLVSAFGCSPSAEPCLTGWTAKSEVRPPVPVKRVEAALLFRLMRPETEV